MIAASDPVKAEARTRRRPLDNERPLAGFHMTMMPPTKVSTTPTPRLNEIVSPSTNTDNSTVNGKLSWPTIAALEGVEVFRPRKNSANPPPPIKNPTQKIRQTGRGTGSNHGRATTATNPYRRTA